MKKQILKFYKQSHLTVPQKLQQALDIKKGDLFQVEIIDNTYVLRPLQPVNPTQSWFWSKNWQKKEKQADKELKEKKYKKFKNAKDLIKDLNK